MTLAFDWAELHLFNRSSELVTHLFAFDIARSSYNLPALAVFRKIACAVKIGAGNIQATYSSSELTTSTLRKSEYIFERSRLIK
jgi:hypothetical protein